MSDTVYSFPGFGPASEVIIPAIDSVSLALVGTIVLEGGNIFLEPVQGVRIGQDAVYFVATISEAGSPPINGEYVYRASNFVQTARSANLGSNQIFGGIATDGNLIYAVAVPNFGQQAVVYALDPITLATLDSASFGPSPGSALAEPTQAVYANGRIFVGLTLTTFPTAQHFICVIDPATLTATTLTVGSAVDFCVASPDQTTVYAAGSSGVVYVVDTTSLAILTETVSGAFGFSGGTISPNGKNLWLSASNLIFVVDTTTFAIIQAVPTTGDSTDGLGMSSDGSTVFTAATGQAFAINTVTYVKTQNLNAGVLGILVVPGVRPTVPPPTLQKPRDDNLALGAVRQRVGPAQPSSRQYSIRQGGKGTYS